SATSTAPPPAERATPTRPAAPSRSTPSSDAVARPSSDTAEHQCKDDDEDDKADRESRWLAIWLLARDPDAFKGNVPALRDAADDTFGTDSQPVPVAAVAKFRNHVLTTGLSGEPIRDPLLELVPDFDPNLPFTKGEQDQQAVVLALLTDPTTVVLEQLGGVFADVTVRLDGWHRRDHHDVAAGRLQRANHSIDSVRIRSVDNSSE